MIFCTAGHVDHGKTALVRALTGVDTDRLAEERRRGLTIELGFAPLELPGVGRVSLVDVPGHAQFIPTMLSGLPDVLIAIVVILVLSASMSTLSSLVLTSSSTLTLDLIRDHLVKGMSQKKQVLVMRCLIVVFIAISVVLAIIQYKSNVTFIAQLMGVSWGALAGAFLAPFLYGLYLSLIHI